MKTERPKFYVAKRKAIDSLITSYNEDYSKSDIVTLLTNIRKSIKSHDITYVDADENSIEVPDHVMRVFGPNPAKTFYAMRKEPLVEALAYFNADSRNADLQSDKYKTDTDILYEQVAANGLLNAPAVNKLIGKDAVEIDSRSWWSSKIILRPDIKKFRIYILEKKRSYTTYAKDVYLRLPVGRVNDSIRNAFPNQPKVIDPNPEKDPDILTVNVMNTVAYSFSIASAMLEAGTISIGVTKLANKSDLKKYRQSLIPDPRMDAVEMVLNKSGVLSGEVSLQACALTGYFFYKNQCSGLHKESGDDYRNDPANIVRDIVANLNNAYCKYTQIVNMMLPAVSGFTAATTRSALSATVMACMYGVLGEIEDKRWTPVDNIVHEVYRRLYQKNREILFGSNEYWPDLGYKDSKESKEIPIDPGNAVRKMTFPLVRGYLFFLTALGVLETSIDNKADISDGDPFSCLKYTRLTPLGMYALGKGPHIDLTVNADYIHNFELINNPLIIVSPDLTNPYNSWLNRIGTARGNRWIVTPKSFLSNCNYPEDINNLIKDFKKYICEEPSPAWQAFFDRMTDNAGAGGMWNENTKYLVYHVNITNKDLQKFLATDPEIRKLIIRAEGYRILVRDEDYLKFRLVLRNAGYLI